MYGIGDEVWPGLGKLMEEMGELQQALAKLISTKGEVDYWDGTNLVQGVMEELADVRAAHDFFIVANGQKLMEALGGEFDGPYNYRVKYKKEKFILWHWKQLHERTPEKAEASTMGAEPMDEPQG